MTIDFITEINGNALRECNDVSKIDDILDDMNIVKSRRTRINFLHQFMGVKESFSCGVLTEEEEYAIAKEELVVNHNGFDLDE